MTTGPRDMNTPRPQKQNGPSGLRSSGKIITLKQVFQGGGRDEKVFKFDKDRIVIGSVVSADLRVSGDGVSPIHAVLEKNEDRSSGRVSCTLFDLASDTGVFVNDKKVITHSLSPQDQIVIGRHRFKFLLEDKGQAHGKDSTRETEGRTLYLNPNEDLKPLLLEDERGVDEIFDYRPTSKRALEVVMSWSRSILDVGHFVHERKIILGNTKNSHFGIPPLLSSKEYPMVTQDRGRGEFVLNLDSQMKGVIQRKGELKTLDEIRGTVPRGPDGYQVLFGDTDFAKIGIGDIDFYFSFTAAPPRLKMRRLFEKDPFFLKIFMSSMLLTGLLIYSLVTMKVSQNVEAEQVPERIATILYQPEKFMRPPPVPSPRPTPPPKVEEPPQEKEEPPAKPVPPPPKKVQKITVTPKPPTQKPIPKVIDVRTPPKPIPPPKQAPVVVPVKPAARNRPAPKAEAQEGEGARAKGKEGSRGEPDKKANPVKSTELTRPSPKTGTKGAAGESEVPDEGNVDILKGAGGRIQNILGNSAARLGDGGEKIKGFGNFSSRGSGGLALSGSGQGGGGDAETSLGGLGKKGSGMGRIGTGKGAAGSGSGIVGAHVRVDIRTDGPEESVVMGAIDRDAVAEAIYAHKDEFRLCYEREINAEHPGLSGQIGTRFVIGSSGRVTQAGIESSSLHNPNTERCVLKVLKRIDFPAPNGGGIVEVHFPFKFSATGQS